MQKGTVVEAKVMESKWLCYYELHVDDETFLVHVVVSAKSMDEAMDKLNSQYGDHYHLQAKGCLGHASLQTMHNYLQEA